MNFCGSLCSLLEYFLEETLSSDYPCKSHYHDHQWAVLVISHGLITVRQCKCEHNIVRLVFVYILLSTCQ